MFVDCLIETSRPKLTAEVVPTSELEARIGLAPVQSSEAALLPGKGRILSKCCFCIPVCLPGHRAKAKGDHKIISRLSL